MFRNIQHYVELFPVFQRSEEYYVDCKMIMLTDIKRIVYFMRKQMERLIEVTEQERAAPRYIRPL